LLVSSFGANSATISTSFRASCSALSFLSSGFLFRFFLRTQSLKCFYLIRTYACCRFRAATAGVFSGLGEALAQDDIADKEEWFSFKKKEDKTNLEASTSEQERNGNKKNNHLNVNSGSAE
jgi:hypothetical protein